jgi:hypothetical protein
MTGSSMADARYRQYVRYCKARGITPVSRAELDAAADDPQTTESDVQGSDR